MPNPARPPTTRLIDSAVDTAPRLQPKASTTTGRKTPKAARGMAMPQVTRKRPATISQRRADGRSRRLFTLEPSGRGRPRSASGRRTGAAGGSSRWARKGRAPYSISSVIRRWSGRGTGGTMPAAPMRPRTSSGGIDLTAPHRVELRVRLHVREIRHAVRQIEEGGHRPDIPDVGVREAVATERLEVGLIDLCRALRHLDGEVEHGTLAWGQLRVAVVRADLVGEIGILAENAEGGAVGHRAVGAGVDAAHRHHDHLPLGAREARGPLHEHVVVVEEGAEVLGLVPVGEEHIGREARFGGVAVHDLTDVGWQALGSGDGEAADRLLLVGHDGTLLDIE